nr:putative reverse transcriptase domain-containing protein [Tanacetum cinerariifolium]
KKLDEKEVLLDLTRIERDRADKRLSESIWWNERFYLEMVRKGVVPKPPSDDKDSERPRKMPKKIMPPKPMSEARMREIIRDQFATSMNEFMANMNNGTGGSGGASDSGGAGGECKEKDRVKFAMATLCGRVLTWWNKRMKAMGIEAANNTPWSELIQDKADEATEGEKRKGEGDRGSRGDNRHKHNRR